MADLFINSGDPTASDLNRLFAYYRFSGPKIDIERGVDNIALSPYVPSPLTSTSQDLLSLLELKKGIPHL